MQKASSFAVVGTNDVPFGGHEIRVEGEQHGVVALNSPNGDSRVVDFEVGCDELGLADEALEQSPPPLGIRELTSRPIGQQVWRLPGIAEIGGAVLLPSSLGQHSESEDDAPFRQVIAPSSKFLALPKVGPKLDTSLERENHPGSTNHRLPPSTDGSVGQRWNRGLAALYSSRRLMRVAAQEVATPNPKRPKSQPSKPLCRTYSGSCSQEELEHKLVVLGGTCTGKSFLVIKVSGS